MKTGYYESRLRIATIKNRYVFCTYYLFGATKVIMDLPSIMKGENKKVRKINTYYSENFEYFI